MIETKTTRASLVAALAFAASALVPPSLLASSPVEKRVFRRTYRKTGKPVVIPPALREEIRIWNEAVEDRYWKRKGRQQHERNQRRALGIKKFGHKAPIWKAHEVGMSAGL